MHKSNVAVTIEEFWQHGYRVGYADGLIGLPSRIDGKQPSAEIIRMSDYIASKIPTQWHHQTGPAT